MADILSISMPQVCENCPGDKSCPLWNVIMEVAGRGAIDRLSAPTLEYTHKPGERSEIYFRESNGIELVRDQSDADPTVGIASDEDFNPHPDISFREYPLLEERLGKPFKDDKPKTVGAREERNFYRCKNGEGILVASETKFN